MNDRDALLAALLAQPGEDTPRLMYADWLEEHGDPDRAEFIRVQCELAADTPDDDRHCDLLEREAELRAVLADRLAAEWPDLPSGWLQGEIRRGFPEEVILQGRYVTPTDELPAQFEAVASAMPLTRCQMHFSRGPAWELIRHPVAGRLRGLEFVSYTPQRDTAALDLIATSPHLSGLQRLSFSMKGNADDLARLLRTAAATNLRSFHFSSFDIGEPPRSPFADAPCRERLAELGTGTSCHGAYHRLAGGQAFPAMRRLNLFGSPTTDIAAEVNDLARYPVLADLNFNGTSGRTAPPGVFDRPLRSIRWETPYHDPDLATFLSSPALRTLRRVELEDASSIGVGWAERAARPGVFGGLRHLDLAKMGFTPEGLQALAAAPFWETVTSLRLRGWPSGRVGANEWTAFVRTLNAPALRHLTLVGVPLKSRGGLALAANRSLANLRLLTVRNASLGRKAIQAILTAQQFQSLLALDLSDDTRQEGFDPLADAGVMPHAKSIRLGRVKLPPEVAEKLRRREGVSFGE